GSKGPNSPEPRRRRAASSSTPRRLIISDRVGANFKDAKAAIGAANKGQGSYVQAPRSSESSPAKSTLLADELSTASRQPTSARSDEGIGVPPSDPTTVLRTKAKQRDKIPNSRDHGRATPLLNSQRSTDYSGRAEVPLSALVLVVNPIHRGARRWSAPTGDAMSLHGQSAQPAT